MKTTRGGVFRNVEQCLRATWRWTETRGPRLDVSIRLFLDTEAPDPPGTHRVDVDFVDEVPKELPWPSG